MIRYHAVTDEENNQLYGPGKRVVIWTQGCSLRCEGCTNQHLWDRTKGKDITAKELIDICSRDEIDGITLHGGEPIEQLDELFPVVKAIHESNKSVILFTGYEIEELTTDKQKEFLSLCDLIKCGRFDKAKLNRYLHFRGSDNQRIIIISDRFKNYKIHDGQNVVLLTITLDGEVNLKGFPDEVMRDILQIKDYE